MLHEEQIRKWGCSFQDLLTDVTGRYKFEGFCKAQYIFCGYWPFRMFLPSV